MRFSVSPAVLIFLILLALYLNKSTPKGPQS